MKVEMKATRGMVYAGRRRAAGERFTAVGESDARLLIALGRAERAAPEPVEPPPAAPAKHAAHAAAASADAGVETKPKRQYRRRDMTAEPTSAPPAAPEPATGAEPSDSGEA